MVGSLCLGIYVCVCVCVCDHARVGTGVLGQIMILLFQSNYVCQLTWIIVIERNNQLTDMLHYFIVKFLIPFLTKY